MISTRPASTSRSNGRTARRLVAEANRWGTITALAGFSVALLLSAFSTRGVDHLLHTYLVSVCFVVSLALGALFFVLLQHLTRAGWSVVVRRIAEVVAATMPYLLILFVPLLALLLLGDARLYRWNDAALRETDALIRGKSAYLNGPFFAVRTLFYFAAWSLVARYFWRTSLRQDAGGDKRATLRMQWWSGPAMMVFAVTTCFAAFDWLMSLDPHWFSTIFGVYFFAGAVVGSLAFVTLAALALESAGVLRGKITAEHYHDLGKLLLGFVMFWAYIAFSQYLLIWYANIPEETGWYFIRQNGGWQWVSLLLLIGNFALPFCGLMTRGSKRRRVVLASWSAWLLLMHWADLYWLVMPSYSAGGVPLGISDLLILIGVCGYFTAAISRVVGTRALVPVGDPRLRESLSFHNV